MAEATQAPPAAGTFCWNELLTRDVPKAREFFTKLLGWTTEEMDMGPQGTYTIFKQGDTKVGGCMHLSMPGTENVPPHWMAYIAVKNVDDSTKKAERLGAKICHGPADIPDIGRFSVITDPSGGTVGLYQALT